MLHHYLFASINSVRLTSCSELSLSFTPPAKGLAAITPVSLYLGLWLSPVTIALYWEVQPLQLGKEFWLSVAAALGGIELSALNHLLLHGLLIPLPKGVKARLKGD